MCGIAGIINFRKDISNDYYYIIKNMTKILNKRGPDEDGLYFSKHANLGHRRLSIIDIEKGKQPMSYRVDEITYTIVYNGQIYNSKELKKELEEKGFEFKTNSDTEVILKAYVCYGKEVCKKLNGIFGFGIWNDKKGELFLARDHFGIKPLYYSFFEDNFIFSSEIKAILEFPKIDVVVDKTGICELFGMGPSHSPRNDTF